MSTGRTFRNLQPQQTESQKLASDLSSRGFTKSNLEGGDVQYSSPIEEYTSYQDKKLRQTGQYSKEVYVFNSSGQLVKKIQREPYTTDAYDRTVMRSVRDKVVEDYIAGTITTDNSVVLTNLARTQIAENEVKRSGGLSSVEIRKLKAEDKANAEAYDKARRENVTSVSKDLRTGIVTKTLRSPTYEEPFKIVQQRSQEKRETYLKQFSPTERKRIETAIANNPNAIIVGVDSKALKAYNKQFERGKQNEQISPNISLYSGSATIPEQQRWLWLAQRSNLTSDGLFNYSLFEETQRIKREKNINKLKTFLNEPTALVGYSLDNDLDVWQKNFEQRSEALNKRFQGKGDPNSFIQRSGSEALQLLSTQSIFEGLESGAILAASTIIRPEKVFTFETGSNILQSFNPTTPEGLVNVVSLPLGFKGFKSAKASVADDFLKSLSKTKPSSIFGETFFGEKILETTRKGDLIKSTQMINVEIPNSQLVETRVVKTPFEVLTVGKGKDINIVQQPSGVQVTTRVGSGKFKDYFSQTITQPSGQSVTKVFRTVVTKPTSLDKVSGFFWNRKQFNYDIDFELLKVSKSKTPATIKFTESVNVANIEQELKFEGYTQRLRNVLDNRFGISTSKKGYIPVGKQSLAIADLVQIGQEVPKTEFLFADNVLSVDVFKTEFNIVDYPVPIEKTILRRNIDTASGNKPVQFRTTANYKIKSRFVIDFEKFKTPPIQDYNIKRKAQRDNFLDINYYPKSLEQASEITKPFKQAETFGLQDSRLTNQLNEFDPLGMSGDRLRNNLVQEVQSLKVQRPQVDFKMSDKTLFFENTKPSSFAFGRSISLLKSFNLMNTNNILSLPTNLLARESATKLNNNIFTRNVLKSNLRNEVITRNQLNTINKTNLITNTNLRTETILRTDLMTMVSTGVKTRTPNRAISNFNFNPPVVRSPYPRSSSSNIGIGFDVVVREGNPKGKKTKKVEVKVNKKPLPYNAAWNVGNDYVDNTSARSFRLVKSGKTKLADDFAKQNTQKYRASKNGRYVVEKNSFAIDSLGELQGITARGLKARRNKKNKNIGGWF